MVQYFHLYGHARQLETHAGGWRARFRIALLVLVNVGHRSSGVSINLTERPRHPPPLSMLLRVLPAFSLQPARRTA